MRARLLLLTWIVATAAATGVAWLGVRSVLGDVADPLPARQLVVSSELASGPAASDPPEAGGAATRAPASSSTRTFTLTGGTATVRFTPDGVAVISAVPAAGYDTDVDDDDDGEGRTRIEFESDDHRSRLEVWWDGRARHRIQEGDDHDADDADDDADEGAGDDDVDDD